MRARDLTLLVTLLLIPSGCRSLSFDGYDAATVGPFFASENGATLRTDVEEAVKRALRVNQVFRGDGSAGKSLYIFGLLGDDYLSAVILDEGSGEVLDTPVFQPGEWDLSGPEAMVPFLAQRLALHIAEHRRAD